MADGSRIEWTDATWNPVTGCTRVSSGCDHCYAERVTERFYGKGSFATVRRHVERLQLPLQWRRPRRIFVNSMSDLFHSDVPDEFIARVWAVMALTGRHTFQVLTKRHGRMCALLSHPDFLEAVARAATDMIGHTGSWRRSQLDLGGLSLAGDSGIGGGWTVRDDLWYPTWPLPNVWGGVSIEDQKWADIRLQALMATPLAVRWVSVEPMLGRIDLGDAMCICRGTRWVDDENWSPEVQPALWDGRRFAGEGRIPCGACNLGGWHEDDVRRPQVDWVVCGGESGPGARPMHPDWARDLRDDCSYTGVPFLFKQWGEWAPAGPLYPQRDDDEDSTDAVVEAAHLEAVEGLEVVQLERSGYIAVGRQPGDDRTWLMARVGKKAAGRLLDGRLHDAYPVVGDGR